MLNYWQKYEDTSTQEFIYSGLDLLRLFLVLTAITPPRKFMLVTTSTPNAIKRIDINTQDTFVIPMDRSQNRQNPMAVDYDPPNARIYWTDIKRGAIRSANLDGSDVMVVCQFNPGKHLLPFRLSSTKCCCFL